MEHRRAIGRLADLDSGETSGEERRQLLAHLAECRECSDWLDTYRLLSQALAGDRAGGGHPPSDRLARHAVDPSRLAADERTALDEHLGRCASCRRELELTRTALGRAGEDRAPARVRWAVAAGVILALALGLLLRPEPHDRELAGMRLDGTQVIEAKGSITAGTSSVESGSDVTFLAGEAVSLSDGFKVGPGATFKVVAGGATPGSAGKSPASPPEETSELSADPGQVG